LSGVGLISSKVFEEMACFKTTTCVEITGLAFDAASSRLAVCHRESVVQMYEMDYELKPRNLFSVGIKHFLPKALAFGLGTGKNREILVFGFHDGQM
jgi:hypothetical protein